jgi:hypothetical protein
MACTLRACISFSDSGTGIQSGQIHAPYCVQNF